MPVSRYRDQFTSTPWPVFRMSVYNIVRKRKILETNLKSEEITNFYPIFFMYCISGYFRVELIFAIFANACQSRK